MPTAISQRRAERPRRGRLRGLVLGAAVACLAALPASANTAAASPPAAALPAVPAAACGTPLTSGEIATIVTLSDTTAIQGDSLIARLEDEVDRQHRITAILTAHRDRRGLFLLGNDAVLSAAVMPLQRAGAFHDPVWAKRLSIELLRRALLGVHGAFTTGAPTRGWRRYDALATGRCDRSPAWVAMSGYNAHLAVDLAYAIATVGTRPSDSADYFKIVDAIAHSAPNIIGPTKAIYGADLAPLWYLYGTGAALDRLLGTGVGSDLVVRVADDGFNTITFADGLAIEDRRLHAFGVAATAAVWGAADAGLTTLAANRRL